MIRVGLGVLLSVILISGSTVLVFGDHGERQTIRSPNHQISEGVLPHEVQCLKGKTLVVKSSGIGAACVKATTYAKLIATGWGMSADTYKSILEAGKSDEIILTMAGGTIKQEIRAIIGFQNQQNQSPIVNDTPVVDDPPVVDFPTNSNELSITVGFPNKSIVQTMNQRLDSSGDNVASFRANAIDDYPNLNQIYLQPSRQDILDSIPEAKSKGFEYLGYDIERGFLPDPNELDSVPQFISEVSDEAHKNGLKLMVGSSRPTLAKFWDKTDWSKVDVFLLPLQKVAGTPDYQNLGEKYGSHARNMNPDIIIFSNINLEYASIDTAVNEITQLKNKGIIDGVSILGMRISDADFNNLLTALGR